jgi:hypothetical protein
MLYAMWVHARRALVLFLRSWRPAVIRSWPQSAGSNCLSFSAKHLSDAHSSRSSVARDLVYLSVVPCVAMSLWLCGSVCAQTFSSYCAQHFCDAVDPQRVVGKVAMPSREYGLHDAREDPLPN